MRNRKAQASMEYIVVAAMVFVIALIAIALLTSTGQGAKEQRVDESKAYWRGTTPIAIEDAGLSDDGITLAISNKNVDQIRLNNITLNGSGSNGTLVPNASDTYFVGGEKRTVQIPFTPNCEPGSVAEYRITINYAKGGSGIIQQEVGAKPLALPCPNINRGGGGILDKSCPDGSTVPIWQSCPGQTQTCPDGSTIPIGQTCPGVQTCPDGFEMVGQNCLEICPDGFARVGETCVLTCPDGQQIAPGQECPYETSPNFELIYAEMFQNDIFLHISNKGVMQYNLERVIFSGDLEGSADYGQIVGPDQTAILDINYACSEGITYNVNIAASINGAEIKLGEHTLNCPTIISPSIT